MIRIIIILLKLALLTAAAVWLANRPGLVTVNWLGYEVTTSFGLVLLALIVLVALAVTIITFWRGLIGIPHSLSLGHLSRRQRKGYLALTQGLVAVAAGDAATARKLAFRAEKYLNEPPLTLLLQAQAAQLAGDENAAARYFNSMLERPELSFLGLRGLITQALKRGDADHALTLVRRAQVLQPKADWVLAALVDLEARAGNWRPAADMLARAIRQGAIGPERGKKLRAVFLLGQSGDSEKAGRLEDALEYARQAHETLPALVPATASYARHLIGQGRGKLAAKIIERTWRLSPHPELAALYRQADQAASPLTQVRRLERLAGFNPAASESRLSLARAALDAQLWGIAREQLAFFGNGDTPPASACSLLAELSEKENGDTAAARAWLARAATATPPAVWVCTDCQTPASVWQPLCSHCSAPGTLEWKTPAGNASPVATASILAPAPAELKSIAKG